jgi:Fe-S cluster biogenesis protein NfuA
VDVDLVLSRVRQRLRSHGGEARVLNVTADGAVQIELLGACCGCPAANFTFSTVIVPALLAVEGVTDVRSRQARYSAQIASRAGTTVGDDLVSNAR